MPITEQAWRNLNEAMTARLTELGHPTWREMADRAGLSDETLHAYRFGRRKSMPPKTQMALEKAFEWVPGGIDDAFAGRRPRPLPGGEDSRAIEDEIRALKTISPEEAEELIMRLRERRAREQEQPGHRKAELCGLAPKPLFPARTPSAVT